MKRAKKRKRQARRIVKEPLSGARYAVEQADEVAHRQARRATHQRGNAQMNADEALRKRAMNGWKPSTADSAIVIVGALSSIVGAAIVGGPGLVLVVMGFFIFAFGIACDLRDCILSR